LEWSDFLVKWSLVVLGAGLMLGLFSRLSSLLMAFMILSFYLAMPPLPGWPESPRLEGHYLVINKTLIEVIALFALTCIPTGRWAGVDALLCWMFSSKQKTA
jgi:thiosulfate dehydrogenase [quinone] large subunit